MTCAQSGKQLAIRDEISMAMPRVYILSSRSVFQSPLPSFQCLTVKGAQVDFLINRLNALEEHMKAVEEQMALELDHRQALKNGIACLRFRDKPLRIFLTKVKQPWLWARPILFALACSCVLR